MRLVTLGVLAGRDVDPHPLPEQRPPVVVVYLHTIRARALARFDNVYMKLSGIDHFANDAPLYESAIPFTRWVADSFGPEPVICQTASTNCSAVSSRSVAAANPHIYAEGQ